VGIKGVRTNAWITIERQRALSWRDWLRWLRDGVGPEPELTQWEQRAARRLGDMEYIFKAFLRPVILTKTWIMLSVYDVTISEINSGYAQLGDAAAGGDFACAGLWEWADGQSFCAFNDTYQWRPTQTLQFMPPTTGPDGAPVPATGVRDVNLMLGQPPREFPV
jgi:hypothetical protein